MSGYYNKIYLMKLRQPLENLSQCGRQQDSKLRASPVPIQGPRKYMLLIHVSTKIMHVYEALVIHKW